MEAIHMNEPVSAEMQVFRPGGPFNYDKTVFKQSRFSTGDNRRHRGRSRFIPRSRGELFGIRPANTGRVFSERNVSPSQMASVFSEGWGQ